MVSTLSIVCLFVVVAASNVAAQYRCGCGSFAPGPYSVSLPNCGPPPCPAQPLAFSQVAPTCVRPTVALPAPCIPPPQTISNNCQCQNTIVKPQVYTNTLTVPSVQKYIQTSYKPVVETINYQAIPQCPCDGGYAGFGGYSCGAQTACGSSYPITTGCGSLYPIGNGCGSAYPIGNGCGSAYPIGIGCGSAYTIGNGCGSSYPTATGCGCY